MKKFVAWITGMNSPKPRPTRLADWWRSLGAMEIGRYTYAVDLVFFCPPLISQNKHSEAAAYVFDRARPPHGFAITQPVRKIIMKGRGPPCTNGETVCTYIFTLLRDAEPLVPCDDTWYDQPWPDPDYTIRIIPFNEDDGWDIHVPQPQDRYRFPFAFFHSIMRDVPAVQSDLLLSSICFTLLPPPNTLNSPKDTPGSAADPILEEARDDDPRTPTAEASAASLRER